MANLIFYIAALACVLASLGVVMARNPVHAVLSLLASFFCLSTIYLLAGFQFLAAAQILVYGGAVMVLFLFVIMLLNLGEREETSRLALFRPGGRAASILVASTFGIAMLIAIGKSDLATPGPELVAQGKAEFEGLAALLFGHYALPLQALGVLLLATTVGVIVLARRHRHGVLRTEAGELPPTGNMGGSLPTSGEAASKGGPA